MRSLMLVVLFLAGSISHARAAGPVLRLKASRSPGTVRVSLSGGFLSRTEGVKPKNLSFAIPVGLARKLVRASRSGLRVTTAHDALSGPQLRIVAGKGEGTLIIDRTRRAGPNGQSPFHVTRYQLGQGQKARAYYVGTALFGENLGQGRFHNRTMYAPRTGKQLIDPKTLKANTGARIKDESEIAFGHFYTNRSPEPGALKGLSRVWYSAPSNKITSDPGRPLHYLKSGVTYNQDGAVHKQSIYSPLNYKRAEIQLEGSLSSLLGL